MYILRESVDFYSCVYMCVCVSVCVCVRARVRVYARACVRLRVRGSCGRIAHPDSGDGPCSCGGSHYCQHRETMARFGTMRACPRAVAYTAARVPQE